MTVKSFCTTLIFSFFKLLNFFGAASLQTCCEVELFKTSEWVDSEERNYIPLPKLYYYAVNVELEGWKVSECLCWERVRLGKCTKNKRLFILRRFLSQQLWRFSHFILSQSIISFQQHNSRRWITCVVH